MCWFFIGIITDLPTAVQTRRQAQEHQLGVRFGMQLPQTVTRRAKQGLKNTSFQEATRETWHARGCLVNALEAEWMRASRDRVPDGDGARDELGRSARNVTDCIEILAFGKQQPTRTSGDSDRSTLRIWSTRNMACIGTKEKLEQEVGLIPEFKHSLDCPTG